MHVSQISLVFTLIDLKTFVIYNYVVFMTIDFELVGQILCLKKNIYCYLTIFFK